MNNATPPPASKDFWKSVLEKAVITTRLTGKEAYRIKLEWFDLKRADYRIGEKAYENRATLPEHNEIFGRIGQLENQIALLGQPGGEEAASFIDKVRAAAGAVVRQFKIAALRARRRRLLRQVGRELRKRPPNASLPVAGEVEVGRSIFDRIESVGQEIKHLRPGTYPWARRPLMLIALLFLMLVTGYGFMAVKNPKRERALAPEMRLQDLSEKSAANLERQRTAAIAKHRKDLEDVQDQIQTAERLYAEEREQEREKQETEELANNERQKKEEEAAANRTQLAEEQERSARLAREKVEREEAERNKQKEQAERDAKNRDRLSIQTTAPPLLNNAVAEQFSNSIPHDAKLLDKLHDGQFNDIGPDKLDLVAVFKAFESAGLRIKDTSDLNPTAAQFAEIARYFTDAQVALTAGLTLPVHPNYLRTAAKFEETGGNNGEWGEKTYKNLVRLVLQRANGQSSGDAEGGWRLMKRLVVGVADAEMPKPKQPPNESDRAAVDKQIQELAAKGAKVILADYGDPQAKSTLNYVHLAFWYGEVPILRRDLLAVSAAHPLADLGNLAVTEVPRTLGEAHRKHAESLAAEEKKAEITPDIDNQKYQEWKGLVPGASATYITNDWKQFGSRKQPQGDGLEEVSTLQSIDGEKAVVLTGKQLVTHAAKIRDSRDPEEKKPPVEEVVELKGKKFQCSRKSRTWKSSWQNVTVTGTTWTSEEVPGGLVRYLEDEADAAGGHYIRDKTLQSFTGGKTGDWSGKPTGNAPFTTVYNFSLDSGIHPKGGLVQGDDGNFYGTTSGTVFKLTPEGVLTTLHSFKGPDGAYPASGLTRGRDGNFYGTTSSNGSPRKGSKYTGGGTVFKITPAGEFTTLHNFGDSPEGREPLAALVESSDGHFYGTTHKGGGGEKKGREGGFGTVFKISATGALTTLHSFQESPEEGRFPEAELVAGSDGNFYGSTYQGGKSAVGGLLGYGTIFKITPAGEFLTLYHFRERKGDGENPKGALVKGSDGEFYGVTEHGGKWPGVGTIFRISPAGEYTLLHSFVVGEGGQQPWAGMTRAKDGNFYGTTINASGGRGIIFQFTPPNRVTTLYSFQRQANPERNPRQAKETAEWAAREKAAGRDHPEMTDGTVPAASLLEAADGSLYGTTTNGGIWDLGTVFKVDPKASRKP